MSTILHGDAQGNNISVTADTTQVYGLAGNDTLTSANHDGVLLIGGSGDDLLQFSGSNGTLSGGTGADIFAFYYSETQPVAAVIEDIDSANDKIIIYGATTPKLSSTADGTDLVVASADGYLSVTLTGVQEDKNYFDAVASEEIWDVLRLTNQNREDNGLTWLTLNQDLTDGASVRANEIIQTFGHTRPDGTSCFSVLNENYSSMGENIAAGQTSASEVVTGWMNSEGHRANILNGNFTKLGVGYRYDFLQYYGHYWVQMFGGTSNDTIGVSQAELANVPIIAAEGTPLVADSQILDASDPANWISDWLFNPNFYTGGWQTISNVVSGGKIYFGTDFTGANFDGNGNFYVGSSVGVLTVQNVWDKIIDVSDAAGKTFITAYEAFWTGVLDGRALSGFELIEGSRYGSDTIFAGDGGSSLWGGAGSANDILVGGDGADIFACGRFQGSDTILNASAADAVVFSDASLSDLVSTNSNGAGTVTLQFNTGNVVTVQGNENFSAAMIFADASPIRFNNSTQTWQDA